MKEARRTLRQTLVLGRLGDAVTLLVLLLPGRRSRDAQALLNARRLRFLLARRVECVAIAAPVTCNTAVL